jgi:hypothetical protein
MSGVGLAALAAGDLGNSGAVMQAHIKIAQTQTTTDVLFM